MSNEIFTAVISSVGGLGVILVALITWLSKTSQSRIIESVKAANATDLAQLKSKLDIERETSLRNSNAQFELYSEVWNHLQDVKSIADRLWIEASMKNLTDFVNILSNARVSINRGRLILNSEHYDRLKEAFEHFENYQVGKARLIELRSSEHIAEVQRDFPEYEIRQQIQENRNSKENFENLLDEILAEFKSQLSLAA